MSKDKAREISMISDLANELERVPERVENARRAMEGWRGSIEKMVKKNPLGAVIGAIAFGWLVAKIGRYV
jgi:hypothetical protein